MVTTILTTEASSFVLNLQMPAYGLKLPLALSLVERWRAAGRFDNSFTIDPRIMLVTGINFLDCYENTLAY